MNKFSIGFGLCMAIPLLYDNNDICTEKTIDELFIFILGFSLIEIIFIQNYKMSLSPSPPEKNRFIKNPTKKPSALQFKLNDNDNSLMAIKCYTIFE